MDSTIDTEKTTDTHKNKIIICTPTYNRKFRLDYIKRAASVFSQIDTILWIVIEDNNIIDTSIEEIIKHYFNNDTTKDKTNSYDSIKQNVTHEVTVHNDRK